MRILYHPRLANPFIFIVNVDSGISITLPLAGPGDTHDFTVD